MKYPRIRKETDDDDGGDDVLRILSAREKWNGFGGLSRVRGTVILKVVVL